MCLIALVSEKRKNLRQVSTVYRNEIEWQSLLMMNQWDFFRFWTDKIDQDLTCASLLVAGLTAGTYWHVNCQVGYYMKMGNHSRISLVNELEVSKMKRKGKNPPTLRGGVDDSARRVSSFLNGMSWRSFQWTSTLVESTGEARIPCVRSLSEILDDHRVNVTGWRSNGLALLRSEVWSHSCCASRIVNAAYTPKTCNEHPWAIRC